MKTEPSLHLDLDTFFCVLRKAYFISKLLKRPNFWWAGIVNLLVES